MGKVQGSGIKRLVSGVRCQKTEARGRRTDERFRKGFTVVF